MDNYNEWATKVVIQKLRSDQISLQKEAIGNNRQDLSRPVLEQLLAQGYTIVKWDSGNSRHSQCLELNNQQWNLTDFIANLRHDASIFEKSHPGCYCKVLVTGPNLSNVFVDSYGNMEYV
jgi:hypothetical protein